MLNGYIPYDTIYQGECGHIEGHAYPVLFVRNETCVFWALGFHDICELIASCTPENIISRYSADTLGAGPLSLLVRLTYTKTN